MAVTIKQLTSTPTYQAYAAAYRTMIREAFIRLTYQTDLMYGNYAAAIRARAEHPWLRLAGPKGKLP